MVLGRLAPDVFPQVRDFVAPSHSYEYLKEAALTPTATSEHQRIRRLLQEVEFGDRKPSEQLRGMRRPRNAPVDDDPMLRELRLQGLPPYLPPLLSAVRRHSKEQTAEMADDIILRHVSGVSALYNFSF